MDMPIASALGYMKMLVSPLGKELSAYRDNVAFMSVGVGFKAGQQDAQRHLMAVGPMQRVAAILGPAGLSIVPAQHCTSTSAQQHWARTGVAQACGLHNSSDGMRLVNACIHITGGIRIIAEGSDMEPA